VASAARRSYLHARRGPLPFLSKAHLRPMVFLYLKLLYPLLTFVSQCFNSQEARRPPRQTFAGRPPASINDIAHLRKAISVLNSSYTHQLLVQHTIRCTTIFKQRQLATAQSCWTSRPQVSHRYGTEAFNFRAGINNLYDIGSHTHGPPFLFFFSST
jgi:hypothetical protein